MKISIGFDDTQGYPKQSLSANLSDAANIMDVLEVVSGLLTGMGYAYESVIDGMREFAEERQPEDDVPEM